MEICPITKEWCNLNPSGEMVYGCLGCKHLQAMEDLILSLRGLKTEDLEVLELGLIRSRIKIAGKKGVKNAV